jgi:hypothetical protein
MLLQIWTLFSLFESPVGVNFDVIETGSFLQLATFKLGWEPVQHLRSYLGWWTQPATLSDNLAPESIFHFTGVQVDTNDLLASCRVAPRLCVSAYAMAPQETEVSYYLKCFWNAIAFEQTTYFR